MTGWASRIEPALSGPSNRTTSYQPFDLEGLFSFSANDTWKDQALKAWFLPIQRAGSRNRESRFPMDAKVFKKSDDLVPITRPSGAARHTDLLDEEPQKGAGGFDIMEDRPIRGGGGASNSQHCDCPC